MRIGMSTAFNQYALAKYGTSRNVAARPSVNRSLSCHMGTAENYNLVRRYTIAGER